MTVDNSNMTLASNHQVDMDRSPLRELHAPRVVHRMALWLVFLFPIFMLTMAFVPWQQSAVGSGRVIAYAPAERAQNVEAPISGIIVAWAVVEGDLVRAGDPIVELADNDARYPERIEAQREAAAASLAAAERGLTAKLAQYEAVLASRDYKLSEMDAKIAEEERKRVGEEAEVETARFNADRTETLFAEGLASERSAELARLGLAKAQASLLARDATLSAAQRARRTAEREAEAKIQSAQADVQDAEAKLAKARADLADKETSVARLEQRIVRAPRDGVVLRVQGGPGGAQVSRGDLLVELVPETESRAVEIKLDGNDVALVQPGDPVRLLFEGWPAVQFVGLPGAAGGTFAGRVAFVDATDDGSGKFRVVVTPDPQESNWPDHGRLRQGVRAKGFVLLATVPLGYEVWRQINGFPPLPDVEYGESGGLPTNKKPRTPSELK